MIRMEGLLGILGGAYVFGMTVDPGELWGKAFPAPSFGHGKVWPVHH